MTPYQKEIVYLMNHRGCTIKHRKKSETMKERFILSNPQGTVGITIPARSIKAMQDAGILTKTTYNLTKAYKS